MIVDSNFISGVEKDIFFCRLFVTNFVPELKFSIKRFLAALIYNEHLA